MSGISAGDELVVTKWIALGGSSELAFSGREELIRRFPGSFVDRLAAFKDMLDTEPEREAAETLGAGALCPLGEGGIFQALWDMGRKFSLGVDVDLKLIPVRQETIEICNHFDVNPYMYDSRGSLLIAVSNGGRLVRKLRDSGINAAVIGEFTKGNDRIVRNGDKIRYLG